MQAFFLHIIKNKKARPWEGLFKKEIFTLGSCRKIHDRFDQEAAVADDTNRTQHQADAQQPERGFHHAVAAAQVSVDQQYGSQRQQTRRNRVENVALDRHHGAFTGWDLSGGVYTDHRGR